MAAECFIGIDVSKENLDVHTLPDGNSLQFVNDPDGICDSGKHRGKRRVWGGRSDVRSILYMAVLSAQKYNPVIRDFIIACKDAGKPHKVAAVASMRKLITILNAMVRSGQPWAQCANAA